MIVSGCAKLAMARGRPNSAARLLGVVEAMRESLGIRLPSVIQTSEQRCAELVRRTLGDHEYESSQHAGRQLTIEETVALVRSELGFA